MIYLAESGDDQVMDHFNPRFWGNPPEIDDPTMTGMTWDSVAQRPKNVNVTRHGEGSNTTYLDGHARFGRWERLWWQDSSRGVYQGAFDPRQ
ncbi:MAG: hypothetical protein KIS66_14295 [Fimbriimonadaceae bacterium]|nr:hypothetical protein [Fimbriimonadaceae bacterium]